jgi:hypothetical protein
MFLNSLNVVPTAVLDFVDTPIPDFIETSEPTTVDEAIVTQGILAHNLNDLLMAYSGLPVVDLILRVGQRNTVLQSLLLACLEYRSPDIAGEFEIVQPENDSWYYDGDEITFQANVTEGLADVTGFRVLFSTGSNTVTLSSEGSGSLFTGTTTLNLSDFTDTEESIELAAVFQAEFGEATVLHSVSFTLYGGGHE